MNRNVKEKTPSIFLIDTGRKLTDVYLLSINAKIDVI